MLGAVCQDGPAGRALWSGARDAGERAAFALL